ncbi:hypothetical protein PGH12_01200 [Chryseobacterium wangxinyae]|uniref:hypothetical protein n=2 Tax=unclassified Chryseobacterium TaxID=2593645 RepID=UPI0022709DD7|nr:hypothetical protein [Chryseobacterium sp. CY350]MCY0977203.1 hypothetical protein [Chryseobacterium sp. CY350]WBZ95776.1 hypothetical protein PGH12_01200 [Chryseobacterium sp. CY350]
MNKHLKLFVIAAGLSANFINAQENPNNSFDFVGQNHNEFLGRYLAANPAKDIKTIYGDVSNILKNDRDFQTLIQTYGYTQVDYQLLNFTETDINEEFKTVINNSTLTPAAKESFSGLISNVYKMSQLENEPSKEDLRKLVMGFETELQRSNLSRDEVNRILYSTSVLRYSAFFWKDHSTNTNTVNIVDKGLIYGLEKKMKSGKL